jgi:circadian clock protein KaiC
VDIQPVSTGITGLDDILRGGLTPGRLYLVEGEPGSGKTTLALQFLMEGVRLGEATLYVTLSETKLELEATAASHGWSLEGIYIHELESSEQMLSPDSQLTMFHPAELELSETTKSVLERVQQSNPRRIVFDSLSEMRLMAQSPLRYRRNILALKQFFAGRQSTVLLLDDCTGPDEDTQLQSIAHGVIQLTQQTTEYGSERRRLRICKMRGVAFRGGYHDMRIRTGGLDIYPRLVAAEHHEAFTSADVASGVESLDNLLGGGIPIGSSTLFIGPAGVGKSTVALQFVMAAAARGERGAIFCFDETMGMLLTRANKMGMPLETHLKSGLVTVQQIDPAELSPGEFATLVRRASEGGDDNGRPARAIMIDSLNGYLHSMTAEKYLGAQLHELFTFLNQRGVITLVTVTQAGMVGGSMTTPVDTTYLADNVILFRYFEAEGHVRRAISALKKRSGQHELTIRELRMTSKGIDIGEPLDQFQGVLTGTPMYVGAKQGLMQMNPGVLSSK